MWYERCSFTLTDTTPAGKPGVRYTPDFVVWMNDGEVVCYEVKGYSNRMIHKKALNEVKVFADTFPFRVYVATQRAKKLGGGFVLEEY